MQDRDLRRITWTDSVLAICAVAGLIITILAGGFTVLSKLDSISYKLDTAIQANVNQDKRLEDIEARVRVLEMSKRK